MSTPRYSAIKSLVLAALATGASSVVSADDSSLSRFGGDTYASFKRLPVDKSSSASRQTSPKGLPERTLQAESAGSASSAWQLDKPTFPRVTSAPSFKVTHPNGFTEAELRALSSQAPVWRQN